MVLMVIMMVPKMARMMRMTIMIRKTIVNDMVILTVPRNLYWIPRST